jgi:hypothetical protein
MALPDLGWGRATMLLRHATSWSLAIRTVNFLIREAWFNRDKMTQDKDKSNL